MTYCALNDTSWSAFLYLILPLLPPWNITASPWHYWFLITPFAKQSYLIQTITKQLFWRRNCCIATAETLPKAVLEYDTRRVVEILTILCVCDESSKKYLKFFGFRTYNPKSSIRRIFYFFRLGWNLGKSNTVGKSKSSLGNITKQKALVNCLHYNVCIPPSIIVRWLFSKLNSTSSFKMEGISL